MTIQFAEAFTGFGTAAQAGWENESGTPGTIAVVNDSYWDHSVSYSTWGDTPNYGGMEKVISASTSSVNYRIRRAIADAPVITAGCSIFTNSKLLIDQSCLLGLKSGTTIVSVGWNGNQPGIYVNGSLTSTSASSFVKPQFIFFEIKVDKANGVFLYANGVEIANASLPVGFTTCQFVILGLGTNGNGSRFSCLYVNSGAQLGPIKVQEVDAYSAADISTNTWGTTVTNPTSLPFPHSSGSYTQTNTAGAVILYDYVFAGSNAWYNSIPLRPEFTHTSVVAMINKGWVASGGIGAANFSFRTKYSGTNYDTPISGITSTSPVHVNSVMETTPWDSTAWDATKAQAAFFGVLNG